MGSYSLVLKNSVEKDLRKIPKELLPHIFLHLENLSDNPLPHDVQKLAGAESLYRVRAVDERIVYQVLHESREVIVYYIRHRSVAYRGL
ncbi:MAG: type II toxin-antitoxin system RelE/ParE family toxin [Methanoregula sp.]|uniref:type II toxin-antitoxin system RelE family toxin n=1 Tax=Methanoregula sp. TaxID=2052170 RepID=UPI003C1E43CF